jgi:general L-amino acid transport system substrate-binding protein
VYARSVEWGWNAAAGIDRKNNEVLNEQKGFRVMKKGWVIALGAAAVGLTASAASAATLDDIKAKGFVQCGVNTSLTGFSSPDDKGEWTGLDVDFCRAVAAAVFGDGTKVKFTPLSAKDRFTALQSGEVDLLSRNTTWTINRDTALGLNFVGVTYYDGQGFMVNRRSCRASIRRCSSPAPLLRSIGNDDRAQPGRLFQGQQDGLQPVVFEKVEEANAAYDAGRCDAYTTDQSGLYGIRLTLSAPDDHVVLPEIISKEPLGPAVRQGDDKWFDIVKWTYYALLNAEELASRRPMSKR